jgi:uncharacterized protein YndB with AHSA1/START domain
MRLIAKQVESLSKRTISLAKNCPFMKKDFKLVTQCIFQAPAKKVWDVTVDVVSYPEWWPYIHNVSIRGAEPLLQKESQIDYEIKGFLPHSLRFHTHVTRCDPFSRIEMKASGDLEGTGISILDESDGLTRATFIWNVVLTPPILNCLSQWKLFHKLFVWNHDFTMKSAVKNMQKRVCNESP